jgi:hypothetical protein
MEAEKMTPDELRERIERSGVSGRQIARVLGIERAQPSKWCRGIKPIPERHVGRIRELTDLPPPGQDQRAQSAKLQAPLRISAFSVLPGLPEGGENRVEDRTPVVAHQRPTLTRSMTGPLHADFVRAHNEASWHGDWKF